MTPRPPLAPGSFLLGSALDMRADMIGACERVFRDFGDVVRIRLGPPRLAREVTLVFHPDGAQRVLAGHAANHRKESVVYSEVRNAFGDGLLTSQDDDWQRQVRKFRFATAGGRPAYTNHITLRPTGPVRALVEPRRVRAR